MSLKIYIDINIFLDSILNRDKGIADEVLSFLEEKDIEIVLNDLSIINIHYFAEKGLKSKLDLLKTKINTFLDEYVIVPVDKDILKEALNSDFIDFEDGVQYFCAKKIGADLIITNDKKGFKSSDIDTISSLDFYDRYIN